MAINKQVFWEPGAFWKLIILFFEDQLLKTKNIVQFGFLTDRKTFLLIIALVETSPFLPPLNRPPSLTEFSQRSSLGKDGEERHCPTPLLDLY